MKLNLKPVENIQPLPSKTEPGSFAAIRKFDIHTGVDIYCNDGALVYAVEDGIVVAIEAFTGAHADSPWWNDTYAILVEGASGVIVYGEIGLSNNVHVGDTVMKNDCLGHVIKVLKKDKGVTPTSMLHFELHKHGTRQTCWWHHNEPQPDTLLDPTDLLNGIFL